MNFSISSPSREARWMVKSNEKLQVYYWKERKKILLTHFNCFWNSLFSLQSIQQIFKLHAAMLAGLYWGGKNLQNKPRKCKRIHCVFIVDIGRQKPINFDPILAILEFFNLPAGLGDDHFSTMFVKHFPHIFVLQSHFGVIFDIVILRKRHWGCG